MEIIYITDVHGARSSMEKLLEVTFADLYIISGDLIYAPFYSPNTSTRFVELQDIFHVMRERESPGTVLEEYVEGLLKKEINDDFKNKAEEYLRLSERALATMADKYSKMELVFSMVRKAPIIVLPGNYDMDLSFTAMAHRQIHKKIYEMDGIRIGGYGGANIRTPGVPERKAVRFIESNEYSEPYEFFVETKPDIFVCHQPAYGHLDYFASYGSIGSRGIASAADEIKPLIVLSGHLHEAYGCEYNNNVFYSNPSNFGAVATPEGKFMDGGYYAKITIEEHKIKRVILKRVEEYRPYDIVDYIPEGDSLRTIVLDEARYKGLKENIHDELSKPVPVYHVEEIQLFNTVKHFFRHYESPETNDRIKMLKNVALAMEAKGSPIAFDLVGSTLFGMADKESDIDIVVYYEAPITEGDPDANLEERIEKFKSVLKEYGSETYPVEIVDAINLKAVEEAIINEDYSSSVTGRFIFYRAICRPVHHRLFRKYEALLYEKDNYRKEVEATMREVIHTLVRTSRHFESFKKYEARLLELDVPIPQPIRKRLKQYLQMDE
ncbi:MAG: nucleotidyltransferase domain-containing protein [Deltaproteobacteria bacterium]|nr:nucleotidyltransferase domain-containing protein [Deltaproteobacteria bacterium]